MMNEEKVSELMREVEVAFADVEADNPDAEPGWEWDVARAVVRHGLVEGNKEEQDEVLRRLGMLEDEEDLW